MFSNATGSPFATGANPVSNATADLNGDGHLDLLFTNYISDNVSVLLGNGTGSFVAATPVAVVNGPREVEAGDLDGDGDIDFIATNYSGDSVSVLRQGPAGSFAHTAVPVGDVPRGLALGDLDGDGDLDFVSANYQSNNVSVMLNNGSAVFAAAAGSPLATGTRPTAVALADFNGDHRLDIAVTSNNTNTVSLLLNNGAGGFATAPSASTGLGPRGIAAGDLDGDGDSDLVVGNFGANTLSILLNNGAGAFTASAGGPLATGNNPYAVTLGDLDGDGDLDIAATNSGASSVSVFINIGSAVFTPATSSPFAVGVSPGGIVMGDFDGDGYLDLSTSNFGSNTTTILINASVHLVGTTGNDPLTGGIGNDLIEGLGGDDSIVGGDGQDRMFGGVGNDTYFVDNLGDVVTENPGAGTDTVQSSIHYQLGPNVENLFLTGNADLQGYGNGLVNTLIGNTGNNLLDGGIGADGMAGGAGNDVYFVDNGGDVVIENAGQGNDTVFSTAHLALSANVETLVLQGGADLQGYGNGLVNTLIGNTGNNLLDGGTGADVMIGGDGNDVYFVDNGGDVVIENAGQGNDAVFSTAHLALSANVETLVLQGSADLQGSGNGLVNKLFGNTGNNLLDGGTGADVMIGGDGNDVYFVDNAGDGVVESAGQGTDAVFASAHFALSANVETLVLQGSADLQGAGNNLVNKLFGNTGNNLLDGGTGADTMYGGIGNDTYFVDNGLDQVVENAGEGIDAVFSSAHLVLSANVETLVLQGGANANGAGNALANAIFGDSSDNMLDGQGNADMLTGNAGNDTFVFIIGQGNGDTVVDFAGNGTAAGDSLRFVGYGVGATFTNIDAAHWQVNYNSGASHEIITFMNAASIHASDFVFL